MPDGSPALSFKKLLVACRGNAAMRVMRACRELGLPAVVAYSEADRDALPTLLADEAVCIGPAPEADSYANLSRILSAAEISGCDALHPGDGFFADQPEFIEAASTCGVTFVGPGADSVRLLRDRIRCRELVRGAGVEVVPGSDGEVAGPAEAAELAGRLGYPVLCKAAAGRGGKAQHVVRRDRDLETGLRFCQAEAKAATGDGRVYIEKLLPDCRHVRVPVLADRAGTTVALAERDLSVQFRYQMLLDESPSPAVDAALRRNLLAAAELVARALQLDQPGAVDFFLGPGGRFYFAGADSRLEPDHAVTEAVTGIDWAGAGIRAAAGLEAGGEGRSASFTGWAMQCRIAAQNPDADFEQTAGLLTEVRLPGGPGVRVDGYVAPGYEVPPVYDPLLVQLVAWAPDRLRAIGRMERCIAETTISGVKTTVGLHRRLLSLPRFRRGQAGALDEELQ
jgi:acetyl-CoA carboxylase biotin carboxylase subunit